MAVPKSMRTDFGIQFNTNWRVVKSFAKTKANSYLVEILKTGPDPTCGVISTFEGVVDPHPGVVLLLKGGDPHP